MTRVNFSLSVAKDINFSIILTEDDEKNIRYNYQGDMELWAEREVYGKAKDAEIDFSIDHTEVFLDEVKILN